MRPLSNIFCSRSMKKKRVSCQNSTGSKRDGSHRAPGHGSVHQLERKIGMTRDALTPTHYRFLDPSRERDPELIYLEAWQGQALRQVRFDGNRYRASNVAYPGQAMDLPSSWT